MNFQDLHEQLRLEVQRRIESGVLTGTALARQTGFKQGHMSNFLTRKRSLSLDGLDRVLAAQGLSVEELMPLELSAAGSPTGALELRPQAGPMTDAIPVVSPSTAMEEAVVRPETTLETVPVAAARLDGLRAQPAPRRAQWQRFVAIRADAAQAAALDPMVAAGAVVVLDRHYASPAPYRAQQRTLYAVRSGAGLLLRFVEVDGGALILRPLAPDFPVQLVRLGARESPADYLVGRVCLVVNEM